MKKLAAIAIATAYISGCATIFSRSNDPITFNSTPEGAVVFMEGQRIGKTPTVVNVKRSLSPPMIEVKADGYYPQRVFLNNTFNTVSLINILFWPGFIVDAATGSMMKASQFNYDVELEKKEATPAEEPSSKPEKKGPKV